MYNYVHASMDRRESISGYSSNGSAPATTLISLGASVLALGSLVASDTVTGLFRCVHNGRIYSLAPVAQWIERLPPEQEAPRSSRGGGALLL